jgi:hypothetical protein
MVADTPPRRVLLFSGHLLDRPGRVAPRFPHACVPLAARAISDALDACAPHAGDLAYACLACGGDLLFAEAALARGLALDARLPQREDDFLPASVSYAGAEWLARYQRVVRHPAVRLSVLPADPAAPGTRYEQLNRWLFSSALRHGVARLRCLCLWNGQPGADPGGTQHVVALARAHLPASQLRIIDSNAVCGACAPCDVAPTLPLPPLGNAYF